MATWRRRGARTGVEDDGAAISGIRDRDRRFDFDDGNLHCFLRLCRASSPVHWHLESRTLKVAEAGLPLEVTVGRDLLGYQTCTITESGRPLALSQSKYACPSLVAVDSGICR